MKNLFCVMSALVVGSTIAGVYDDCQYLFRGTYQWKGTTSQAFVEECANSLTLGNGTPDMVSNWGFVGGKREYIQHKITDVVCPYAGRTLKNRSSLYLAQPTYRNPGDDTVYGYSVRAQFTSPFSSNFTNAYSIVLRYRHEGKMSMSSTETCLFNFGHSWDNDRGLSVYLMGDDENQYVRIFQGKSYNVEFKAMQNSADTRLSSGKWVDIAICRDNVQGANALCLYTCAEGGKLCKQTGWARGYAAKDDGDLFLLSAGEASATKDCNSTTNVAVSHSSIVSKFRGSFQKIAMWRRQLTEDEVKLAFCEDLAAGDLLRLGVDNGSSLEFTARNEATGMTVTETDADLSTDWRYFNAMLTPANKTATVRFTAEVGDIVCNRTLTIKATSDSCSGATMSVALNGKTLAESAGIPADGQATIAVPWSGLKVGENVLSLMRTDELSDVLKIDSIHLGKATPIVDEPQVVEGDVYSGSLGWWRHAIDVNGDGSFNNMKGYPNALLACDEFKSDVSHIWGRTVASNYLVQAVSVVCPASGKVLEDEKCVYFRTLTWKDEVSQKTKCVYGALYRNTTQILNNQSNYTILARMKIENFPDPTQMRLIGVGFTGNRGVGLEVRPEDGNMNNLRPYVWKGDAVSSYTATMSGDVHDRLAVGKWIDYAITVSNHTVRLYTFVEGGSRLIEQEVGTTRNCDVMNSAEVCLGSMGSSNAAPGEGLPKCFRGWLHNAAVWGRALNKEEVLAAMAWPRPDIVRIGVADKTANEFVNETTSSFVANANGDFATASPKVLGPGDSYTVTFDLPVDQRNQNQLICMSAIGEDVYLPIGISVNGLVVTNFSDTGVASWWFVPDAHGIYEAAISRKWLKDGINSVTVFTDADDTGIIRVDSLAVGNGGKRVKVRTGEGLVIKFH